MPGEERDLRCGSCGQGWSIRQTDVANTRPLRFCPTCGTPMLVRETGAFISGAAAFKAYQPDLVAAVYTYWRDAVRAAEELGGACPWRFIDFMRGVIAGHIELPEPEEEDEV